MIDAISWSSTGGEDVCICGVGARTPLGFDVDASAAAVRGSISAICAHPVYVDKRGEPMMMALSPGGDGSSYIELRMLDMLRGAIHEAIDPLLSKGWSSNLLCCIGLPEARPGLPATLGRSICDSISAEFGFSSSTFRVLERGHASGLMGLQWAAQKIDMGEIEIGLVAGVDSYLDFQSLKWLDDTGKLMSAANRNGFPPGEAAGACLVLSRAAADRYGLPILAVIRSAATALEPHSIHSDTVCIGEGLTAAWRSVICSLKLPDEKITATYCDLNGERYRNEELVYALLRTQEAFIDANEYRSPADCWGDVGAASGVLFAALAIAAKKRNYSRGSNPLLWAGSERGDRSAVLLYL